MAENLQQVRDIRSAYAYAKKHCCVQIAIMGKFLDSMVIFQALCNRDMNRDMVSSMPYWLMIKVNSEFQELDKHLLKSVKLL